MNRNDPYGYGRAAKWREFREFTFAVIGLLARFAMAYVVGHFVLKYW
jgi:hypothetical protein